MENNDILPCPCCGNKALAGEDTNGDYQRHWEVWIECTKCGLMITRQYDVDVITLWNKRVNNADI